MGSRIGDTPPYYPTNDPGQAGLEKRLSTALKSGIESFNNEMREMIRNPHLADNGQALQTLGQTVENLHNLSQQALNVK